GLPYDLKDRLCGLLALDKLLAKPERLFRNFRADKRRTQENNRHRACARKNLCSVIVECGGSTQRGELHDFADSSSAGVLRWLDSLLKLGGRLPQRLRFSERRGAIPITGRDQPPSPY